jgi:hypothetical protein
VASAEPGVRTLIPIDGGWRVKTNVAGTHYIDVLAMMFNFRIVETPVDCPLVYDRYWCYEGRGAGSFVRTVLAAQTWDGAPDTEPEGWNKNGQTQEWREPSP